MLFVAVLILMVIIYLIHVTRMQLIDLLKRGDVHGALHILQMFDKVD